MISSAGSTSSIGPDQDPLRRGEPRAIGVLIAIVDDPDVEIGLRGEVGDGLADVAGPHDQQPDARPARQKARRRLVPTVWADRPAESISEANPSGQRPGRPDGAQSPLAVEQETAAPIGQPAASAPSMTIASVNPWPSSIIRSISRK